MSGFYTQIKTQQSIFETFFLGYQLQQYTYNGKLHDNEMDGLQSAESYELPSEQDKYRITCEKACQKLAGDLQPKCKYYSWCQLL